MKEKKYILLKDIPLYKAGTIFVRRFAGSPIYSPIGRSHPIYSERQILSLHGEWFIEDQTELVDAMKVVCQELKEDAGYYLGWHANIAMQFKDEFARWYKKEFGVDFGDDDEAVEVIHEIANNSARNFLDLLIRE